MYSAANSSIRAQVATTAVGLLSLTASLNGEPNTNPTVSTGFIETGAPGFQLSLSTGPVAVMYRGTGAFGSTLTDNGFAKEVKVPAHFLCSGRVV
jgi:hypothetical protein